MAELPRTVVRWMALGTGASMYGAALLLAHRSRGWPLGLAASAGLAFVAFQLASPTLWEHHLFAALLVVAPLYGLFDRGALTLPALLIVTVPFIAAHVLPRTLAVFDDAGRTWVLAIRIWGLMTLVLIALWLSCFDAFWRAARSQTPPVAGGVPGSGS